MVIKFSAWTCGYRSMAKKQAIPFSFATQVIRERERNFFSQNFHRGVKIAHYLGHKNNCRGSSGGFPDKSKSHHTHVNNNNPHISADEKFPPENNLITAALHE